MHKKLIIKGQNGLSSFYSDPYLGGTKTNQSFWLNPDVSQSSTFNMSQHFDDQLTSNAITQALTKRKGNKFFANIKNWMGSEAAASVAGQLGNMLGTSIGGTEGQLLGELFGGAAQQAAKSISGGTSFSAGFKDFVSSNNLKGMGVSAITNQVGGLVGNAVGGDAGTVVSGVTGNLGSSIASSVAKGGNVSQGLKNFATASNLGQLGAGIGSAILDSHTAHSRYSGKKGDLAAGVDMAGSAAGLIGGTNIYGTLGMSAVNYLTGGTDGMTTQDALLGSSSIAGALTAANPFVGLGYIGVSALNSGLGGTSHDMENKGWQDQTELNSMWNSYAGSKKKDDYATSVAGKKYGFTSNSARHEADDAVDSANEARRKLLKIYGKNEIAQIRGNNMIDLNNLSYQQLVRGGYEQKFNRSGKNGMKLPTKQDIAKVRAILSRKSGGKIEEPIFIEAEEAEIKEIQEFKEGGNIIPEGALHARKNNMEGAGKDFTHKGIPVVDKDGEQQAEIERDEIIFRKEVTTKLEELMKDGSDRAALEAGKLLVEEIFHNTEDRTGLIASIIGEEPEVSEEEELLAKMQKGGKVIEELNKLSPEKLEKFSTILKYLNND